MDSLWWNSVFGVWFCNVKNNVGQMYFWNSLFGFFLFECKNIMLNDTSFCNYMFWIFCDLKKAPWIFEFWNSLFGFVFCLKCKDKSWMDSWLLEPFLGIIGLGCKQESWMYSLFFYVNKNPDWINVFIFFCLEIVFGMWNMTLNWLFVGM